MHLLNALAQADLLTLAASASRATNLDGTTIDIGAYEGSCVITLNSSAATAGTNPTLDVKLQHCDTEGGTYADVTGGAFAQVTSAASHQKLLVNANSLKRWVKAVGTLGGTNSPAFTYGAGLVGLKKSK